MRDSRTFISIIRAIGRGQHVLQDIATDTGLSKHQASVYVDRLQGLRMVERRLLCKKNEDVKGRGPESHFVLLGGAKSHLTPQTGLEGTGFLFSPLSVGKNQREKRSHKP